MSRSRRGLDNHSPVASRCFLPAIWPADFSHQCLSACIRGSPPRSPTLRKTATTNWAERLLLPFSETAGKIRYPRGSTGLADRIRPAGWNHPIVLAAQPQTNSTFPIRSRGGCPLGHKPPQNHLCHGSALSIGFNPQVPLPPTKSDQAGSSRNQSRIGSTLRVKDHRMGRRDCVVVDTKAVGFGAAINHRCPLCAQHRTCRNR
jgi:hypothetical protein